MRDAVLDSNQVADAPYTIQVLGGVAEGTERKETLRLSPVDAAAVAVVLGTLEDQIHQLGPDSLVRGTLDEWAQQLSSNPPAWIASTPRPLPSGG